MKRIKRTFAFILAVGMAFSVFAVSAMAANAGYTYYVMAKTFDGAAAEYYVEDEELAQALEGLEIDGEPIFEVEKDQSSDKWYLTACDVDATPLEVSDALATVKELAIESGSIDGDTPELGYGALLLIKTRAGTYFMHETDGTSHGLFETPDPVKNLQLSAKIEITDNESDIKSVDIGSRVAYSFTVQVPNGARKVKVHHVLPDGLTLYTAKDDTQYATKITGKGTTWTEADGVIYWAEGTRQNGTTEYIIEFADDVVGYGGYFTVTCTATVNESAAIAQKEKISVYATFGDNDTASTPSEADLYTFGFDISKVNDAGAALPGTKFTLQRTVGEDTYYYFEPSDEQNTLEARFRTLAEGETAPEVAIDENGKLSFSGFAAGTYLLTETAAADGYEVPTAPANSVIVTVAANGAVSVSDESFSVTNVKKGDLIVGQNAYEISYGTISIVNHSEREMPSIPATGGSGNNVFYLVGGIMMLSAAAVFVLRRKSC